MNFKYSFALSLLVSLSHAVAAPLQQANINKIISDVRVIDPKIGVHAAKLQEVIKDDRGVMTGVKSRTELLFQDLTLTRLGAETYFSFTPGTRDMLLERGAMLLHVPKGRGGARIRAAGITAAILGTTIMIEYLPGRSLKVVVLEGTLRLSNNRRLGENLLLTAGKMVIMKPDAKQLPDPVDVDLAKLVRTSSLIDPDAFRGSTNVAVAPLPSMPLIEREIAGQQLLKDTRGLVDTNLFIIGNGTRVVALSDPAAVLNPRTPKVSSPVVPVKPPLIAAVAQPAIAALPATPQIRDTIDRTAARIATGPGDGAGGWTLTKAPISQARDPMAATDTVISATKGSGTPVTALGDGTVATITSPGAFTLTTNLLSGAPIATAGLFDSAFVTIAGSRLVLGQTTGALTNGVGGVLDTGTIDLLGGLVQDALVGNVDLFAATSAGLDITAGVTDILLGSLNSAGDLLGIGVLPGGLTGLLDPSSQFALLGGTDNLLSSGFSNVGTIDLWNSARGVVENMVSGDRSIATSTASSSDNLARLLGTTTGSVIATTGAVSGTASNAFGSSATNVVTTAVASLDTATSLPTTILGGGSATPVAATLDSVVATPTIVLGGTGSGSSPITAALDTVGATPTAILGGSGSSPITAALDTVAATPTVILTSTSAASSTPVAALDTVVAAPTAILGGGSSTGGLVAPTLDTVIAAPTTTLSVAPATGSVGSSQVTGTLAAVAATPTTILGVTSTSPITGTIGSLSTSTTTAVPGATAGTLSGTLDAVTAAPSAILGAAPSSSPTIPVVEATPSATVSITPVSTVSAATTVAEPATAVVPVISTPTATAVTSPVSTVNTVVSTTPVDVLSAVAAPLASATAPTTSTGPTQSSSTSAAPVFNVTNSNQLLSLLSAAPNSSGGTITFQSAGEDIVVSGQTLKANPGGAVDIRHTGPGGTITLTNATLRGDVVKVGALGSDGRLIIGGGSIDANTAIKLYAKGSNGEVRFVDNVSLNGLSTKTIAGSTVTIANGKVVTIGGIRPASVFTDRPNYSGSGGNGSTSGKFGGAGASTKPFANAPGF